MFCLRFRAALAFWLALGATFLSAQTTPFSPSDAVQQFRDQGGRFEQLQLFYPLAQRNVAATKIAPNAQFLTLDPDQLVVERQHLPQALTLRLPYHGEVLMIDLLEAPLFTPDFTVVTNLSDNQPVGYTNSRHYRGSIRGVDKSLAAVSFLNGEIMGLIADDQHGNLVLGKLDSPENETEYILYSDRELAVKSPFSCAQANIEQPEIKPQTSNTPEVSGCVRVYYEADYELFQNKGSVQNTVDYLTGAFNQVATLYANEQVSTMLSQVYVWVTPDSYRTNSSSNALNDFRKTRQNFNGDLAHLVGIGGNNLGGVAYLDVLCVPSYAYAFSDISTSYSNVPTYSWTVEVLTHEMGHNLGSPHTQSCSWPGGAIDNCFSPEGNCAAGPSPVNGGTIMSYCHLTGNGINFNNGFGALPGNKIRTEVANAGCLSSGCAPSGGCPAPTGLTVTNITTNSALVSWNNVAGAGSYTLQWRVLNTSTWTTVNSPTNPHPLTGLPAGQTIELRLQRNCGASNSDYSYGPIFSTSGGGPSCGAPENLGATLTSNTTAIISWKSVSGANSYLLSYKQAASGSWGTPVSLSNTSYPLNNLVANTKYEVRVLANCSNSSSGYAQISFTTPSGGGAVSCGLPGNFIATPTSSSTADVSWDAVPGAKYYQLWYKPASSFYYSSSIYVNTTSYKLTGLAANADYHVRLRAICSSSASALQTILLSTSGGTGVTCSTPLNFVLKSVNATSAVISWEAVPTAQAYDLQIKSGTSSAWMTFVNLPATVVQITNMASNSSYQVRVRARCSGSNNYSSYTNILTINTPANLTPDQVAEALPATGQVIHLPDGSGASKLNIYPNPSTGFTTITFSGATASDYQLEVLDINSRPVAAVILVQNDNNTQLDLSGLPSGVYFVRALKSSGAPVLERVVKQ